MLDTYQVLSLMLLFGTFLIALLSYIKVIVKKCVVNKKPD